MKVSFLNALQAFEVSFRKQSFAAAAQDLNVTPAAVGQLVKGLENYLGQPLFIRQTGGKSRLIPTELAHSVIFDVQNGFACLAKGMEKLKGNSKDIKVNIHHLPCLQ